MASVVKRAIVKGHVQGVFYRATTREKALALNLTGYAKNLPDGTVEVVAAGNSDNVDILVTWLWTGSPASSVDSVVVSESSLTEPLSSFNTA